jgi:hypothetical protein
VSCLRDDRLGKFTCADEAGVSFWVPGLFGSLAAVPQQPGWSIISTYYHSSVSAGGDVGPARANAKSATIPKTPRG